jgi:hypothetical protein
MSTFWMTWPAFEYVWSPFTVVSFAPAIGPVLLAPGRPPPRVEPLPARGVERDARGVVECDGVGEALAEGLGPALDGLTVPMPTTPSADGSAVLLVCRKAG